MKLFVSGDVVKTKGVSRFISDELVELISSCDLSICNFEAPVRTPKQSASCKAGPSITQVKNVPLQLKQAGFDLVGLANNHIFDYGIKGFVSTTDALGAVGLEFFGAGLTREEQYRPKIFTKGDMTIGLINACETQFGVDEIFNRANGPSYASLFSMNLLDEITFLKARVDKVILYSHAGLENYFAPLYEWKEQYKKFIDWGVDLVIGCHPHVPQGVERYNNGFIFYSLGNFFFDYAESHPSFSVILSFERDEISYEIVNHEVKNGALEIIKDPEKIVNIERLNALMDDEAYMNRMYSETFKTLYFDTLNCTRNKLCFRNGLIWNLKVLVRKICYQKYRESRDLLLGHLIRNESYRFVLLRGLIKKEICCVRGGSQRV